MRNLALISMVGAGTRYFPIVEVISKVTFYLYLLINFLQFFSEKKLQASER